MAETVAIDREAEIRIGGQKNLAMTSMLAIIATA